MASVKIKCPNCENETVFDSAYVGKQVRCPVCKQMFWAKKSLVVSKLDKTIKTIAWVGAAIIVFGLTFGRALMNYLAD